MAASHPDLFHKLFTNHFLPNCAVLQWHPAASGDIPTPNTNEIVVFSTFFQRGCGLLTCDFFRGLLDHYQIEFVHLNPNSILRIAIFVHLCKAFPLTFLYSKITSS
jgi:hypothetical protein